MLKKTDILIIGGGPAGITFARTVKKLKPETSITMLRPEQYSMVYCAIPYAIEGLFDPKKVYKKDDIVTEVGVDLIQRAAVDVSLKDNLATDDKGDTYNYTTLFIATGASPILPPIPGAESDNVYTVKTQQDMECLIERVGSGAKRAVVVGAGAIGIEQAQAYQARGLDVTLVDMATRVLPNMLDDDMAVHARTTLEQKGIHLLLGQRVEKLDTVNNNVSAIHLSDGTVLEIDPEHDFVCFAVGMKPDVDLFRDQGMEMNRDGIVIDSRMRTNLPHVYAAGDCCSFFSAIDGKPLGGKLATNAVPMGKIAGRVYAGKSDEYPGFYNGAATCAYDLRVGSTGFTQELAEQRGFETIVGYGHTTTLFPMMPGATDLRIKIVADARNLRILGGQVVSSLSVTDKVDVITLAIQQGLTLKGLARLSYSSQPWQSFFPAKSAIVEACEHALDTYGEQTDPEEDPDLLECV